MPKHADRGSTSTATTASVRDPRRYPLRHTPDTPLAGAATPTQRDTNQALDRARTASYMIKINNATSENNPPWWPGEFPGPTRTSLSGAPAGAVPRTASSDTWTRLRRALAAAARAVPQAGRLLLSWLVALPRRL